MRNFSLGAILSVLLVVVVLFWGPLSKPALAQSGITLGFAVDGSGLIVSSELGEEVGAYLEQQLSLPVKVRSFTTEDHLYNWLTRFREVDVAWLSSALLDRIPDGELVLLSRNLDHFFWTLSRQYHRQPGLECYSEPAAQRRIPWYAREPCRAGTFIETRNQPLCLANVFTNTSNRNPTARSCHPYSRA